MVEIELVTTAAQPTVSVHERVNFKEIGPVMGRLFGEAFGFAQANGVPVSGPAFAYYHSWAGEVGDIDCGFMTTGPFKEGDRVKSFVLPAVKAVKATHVGSYSKLMETYNAMQKWADERGLELDTYMWELYLNGPNEVPEEQLITHAIWPVKNK